MKKPTTVLELLSDPKSWIRYHWAQDSSGNPVHHNSPHATCWCLDGAIMHIYGGDDEYEDMVDDVSDKIREEVGGIICFNDKHNTTHDDIIRVVRKAGV